MVSMGIGNKPFVDIQSSDAALNDRAIKAAGNMASALSLPHPVPLTGALVLTAGPRASTVAGWVVATSCPN